MFHRKADVRALRYAGLMGHQYASVAGNRECREVISETNSAESARANLAAYHVDPAIYRKIGKTWELVEIVDLAVDLR